MHIHIPAHGDDEEWVMDNRIHGKDYGKRYWDSHNLTHPPHPLFVSLNLCKSSFTLSEPHDPTTPYVIPTLPRASVPRNSDRRLPLNQSLEILQLSDRSVLCHFDSSCLSVYECSHGPSDLHRASLCCSSIESHSSTHALILVMTAHKPTSEHDMVDIDQTHVDHIEKVDPKYDLSRVKRSEDPNDPMVRVPL